MMDEINRVLPPQDASQSTGSKAKMCETHDPIETDVASFRVGLCQVGTAQWDVERNFHRTMDALERAADLGATLAITPECVLHGYPDFLMIDDIERMRRTSESLDGERITAIRQLANRRNMHVAVGFAEKGINGSVHNSVALINTDGDIVTVYRKVHCREFEADWHTGAYTPGDTFTVTEIQHGDSTYRLGIIICFDREITESIRCLRAMGAEFIICPLATDTFNMDGDGEERMINNEVLTRCRAVENEVFIAVVNHAKRYNGGSYVVDPLGRCIHRMGTDTDVAVVDVPINQASKMHEDSLSWMGWGFRRPEVYGRYLLANHSISQSSQSRGAKC